MAVQPPANPTAQLFGYPRGDLASQQARRR